MIHSAVADAKPWPQWLCPSGALASQLLSLRDMPCFSDEPEEKEPAPFPAVAAMEETQEEKEKHDDDDDDGDPSSPTEMPVPTVLPSPTSPGDEQSHRKAAVSARLAQDEEEARAQAAVAAKRKQAATLEGCVHLGKVKQKPVDLRWWVKGVHQIVLWVGTARQGKGASKGSAKGKGAGAAVAERYPKAKTKGKKW